MCSLFCLYYNIEMNFKLFLTGSIFMSVFVFLMGIYFSNNFDFLEIFLLPDKLISSLEYGIWMAVLILLVLISSIIFPKIDPLKPDFKSFSKEYYLTIFSTELFILYIFILDLFKNFDFEFNYTTFLSLGFALVFWVASNFLFKVKRSWFLGIRTPWTIKSDLVFEKTNKVAGRLFRLLAGLSVLGFLLNDSCLYFSVIPLFIVMIFIFFYSYFIYQNHRV